MNWERALSFIPGSGIFNARTRLSCNLVFHKRRGTSRPLSWVHRSALGKCHLSKQPGKKVCALLSAFGFGVLCGLGLGAVRGTFN